MRENAPIDAEAYAAATKNFDRVTKKTDAEKLEKAIYQADDAAQGFEVIEEEVDPGQATQPARRISKKPPYPPPQSKHRPNQEMAA